MRMPSVLVVEDENIIADSLRRSLARLGYAVSGIVASGEDAVDHASAARPDVVLMDLTLSGTIDGVEAAQRIRSRTGIPVVFLTSHADRATLARIAAAKPQGYQGYIVKPYSEIELQKTLQHALALSA